MTDLSHSQKNASFFIKRIFGIILLLTLAAVFLYSAYSKFSTEDAFNQFQWTFLDLGIKSTVFAGVIARLFIGLELALGLFLLAHIYLRQVTYPLTIIILLLFIVYLIFVIATQGNDGNCGCFGNKITMTPLNAIWKNLAMIAAVVVLRYIYPIKPYKNQEWLAAFIGMAALVVPFVLNPVNVNNEPDVVNQPIDLDSLYRLNPAPKEDLRQGKHIIAFMSFTCPHCKRAAYLLQIIHHQHPELPIFLVLNGSATFEKPFFEQTHAMPVPHAIETNTEDFLKMAGPSVPAIYWVNNGVVERKSTYYQLDPQYMQDWIKK